MALYIAAYGSGAGKSSTCLAVLSALLASPSSTRTFSADELCYVKPVTQCEADTDVAKWCKLVGIEAHGLGPVVFRAGVTNAFIDDCRTPAEYAAKQAALLASIVAFVAELRSRKRLVVIDGVGYPSVGSVCGVGAREVVAALRVPVLLIGPGGLGDSVDTVTVMNSYFCSGGPSLPAPTIIGYLQNKGADTARHRVAQTIEYLKRLDALVGHRRRGDDEEDVPSARVPKLPSSAVQLPRFLGYMRDLMKDPELKPPQPPVAASSAGAAGEVAGASSEDAASSTIISGGLDAEARRTLWKEVTDSYAALASVPPDSDDAQALEAKALVARTALMRNEILVNVDFAAIVAAAMSTV